MTSIASTIPFPVKIVALVSVLVAACFGITIGLGSVTLTFGLLGLCAAAGMMLLPGYVLVAAMLALCLVGIGLATYFLDLKQALWLAYGLGFAFYLRVLALKLSQSQGRRPTYAGITASLLGLIVVVAASALINKTSFLQTIVGAKNIIGLPGLCLFVAAGGISIAQAEKLFGYLLALPALQIPFALYQNIVIAPKRSDYSYWDAVVGTMGGRPEGGGASGSLAIMMTMAAIIGFASLRARKISRTTFLLVIASCVVPLMLAETKVIVVLIPTALLAFGVTAERLGVVRLAGGVLISAVAGLLILYGYNQTHYAGTAQHSDTVGAMLDEAFGYSLDSTLINAASGEVGRTAIFDIWWNDVVIQDTANALLGYGPGASRGDSDFVIGKLAQRYGFEIDRSTAARLLWDIGILGLAAFAVLHIVPLGVAIRLGRNAAIDPDRKPYLGISAAIIAMAIVSFAYGRELLESPPLGCLTMFAIGYVSLVWSSLRQSNS